MVFIGLPLFPEGAHTWRLADSRASLGWSRPPSKRRDVCASATRIIRVVVGLPGGWDAATQRGGALDGPVRPRSLDAWPCRSYKTKPAPKSSSEPVYEKGAL